MAWISMSYVCMALMLMFWESYLSQEVVSEENEMPSFGISFRMRCEAALQFTPESLHPLYTQNDANSIATHS